MFKSGWSNGFASGLIIGIISAAFFAAFNGWAGRLVQCLGGGPCEGYAQKYKENEFPEWWWWHWNGDLVSSSDSLAQWLMAILTIVAAVLLWLTLRQANKTNVAAIDAAAAAVEANEIMRQEQRPWVTIIREVECEANDRGHLLDLSWNYDLANKGKSPAYDVHIDWLPVKRNHYQKIDVECAEYAQHCIQKRQRGHTPIIFPGETTKFLKFAWSGGCRYAYIQEGEPNTGGQIIIVLICVSYRLTLNSNEFGAEVIAVALEESKRWLRPFSTKMLEVSNARYIQ